MHRSRIFHLSRSPPSFGLRRSPSVFKSVSGLESNYSWSETLSSDHCARTSGGENSSNADRALPGDACVSPRVRLCVNALRSRRRRHVWSHHSRLHVVLTLLLVEFTLFLGCGVLVLLVLGDRSFM